VPPDRLPALVAQLPPTVEKIGVFADADLGVIAPLVPAAGLTGVQLHGEESPEFCQQLRQVLPPQTLLIKAFRLRDRSSLGAIPAYDDLVDAILVDAYHPDQLGGTGQVLDWSWLTDFAWPCPWLLAGGLNPDNITAAIAQVHPPGIDLSSGVERSPGDKDLTLVARLFDALAAMA
jgi:phosphoribosylanthranilate isomerase